MPLSNVPITERKPLVSGNPISTYGLAKVQPAAKTLAQVFHHRGHDFNFSSGGSDKNNVSRMVPTRIKRHRAGSLKIWIFKKPARVSLGVDVTDKLKLKNKCYL
jgi:hypothetical protein